MRHLRINNFGPIKEANLDLGQVNIIIGQQSSGKSCVLKTACYCAWVEKRIELSQNIGLFSHASSFIDRMTEYYSMTGYVRQNTYIEYESEYLQFSYDHSTHTFKIRWKSGRWNYRRPKVSYVPADRNLVAAIPGWSSLPLDENLLEFMSNWDMARKSIGEERDILGLGMSYVYDKHSNTDKIRLDDGYPLMLKEGSSGLQSLIPMFVHLDYIINRLSEDDSARLSYEQKEERRNLLEILHSNIAEVSHPESQDRCRANGSEGRHPLTDEDLKMIYENFIKVDHSEIFLEEPEDNLYPPTQCQFVDWLLDSVARHDDFLFVATHSPYILNQFIKDAPQGLTVFFTHRDDKDHRLYTVCRLDDEELREVYENGVDMFFNFEAYL